MGTRTIWCGMQSPIPQLYGKYKEETGYTRLLSGSFVWNDRLNVDATLGFISSPPASSSFIFAFSD